MDLGLRGRTARGLGGGLGRDGVACTARAGASFVTGSVIRADGGLIPSV